METKAATILDLQKRLIKEFHKTGKMELLKSEKSVLEAVGNNTICNYILWHLEDDARRNDVPDAEIARIKRSIDVTNQKRNDFIEKIDEIIIDMHSGFTESEINTLPMNSETPGAIIDRLCIINLKIYHMEEEVNREDAAQDHRNKCSDKLKILEFQRKDLAASFDVLMDELLKKQKQLRVYRQFKMYNDPNLNPSLYKKNC